MKTSYSKYHEYNDDFFEKNNQVLQKIEPPNHCLCTCHFQKFSKEISDLIEPTKSQTDFSCLSCCYHSCSFYQFFTEPIFEEWKKGLIALIEKE